MMRETVREDFLRGYVDSDNTFRWKSNDRVPFEDMLEDLYLEGYISRVEMIRSNQVRETEVTEFLREARANATPPSEEELMEMRAAFGPGETVVNVITGVVTQL